MAKTTYSKKLKNGKEYYFFRLRHKNLSKPKDIYAPTVKELDKKIKAIIYNLDNDISENKECFSAFFKTWLFNVHCLNKKPSTIERYEGIYRNYIKDEKAFTNLKVKDLNANAIQEYYSLLIKRGKSVSIITHLHKLIAPCIRYAYNNNLILKDFSKALVIPKESEKSKLTKEKRVNPFTLGEQKQFIAAIKGNDLEVLLLTALNTGMRKGELLALTWKDIDFTNKVIKVNKSVKRVAIFDDELNKKYKKILQTPKTENSNRIVPIPNVLIDYLKTHEIRYKESKLKAGNLFVDNKLVFSNNFGEYLNGDYVLAKYKDILKNNGLKDKSFHDLRHTYATRLFELGEAPKTVQSLLGHSNVSITLDTYTHVLDSMKETAVSKLNDLYINIGL